MKDIFQLKFINELKELKMFKWGTRSRRHRATLRQELKELLDEALNVGIIDISMLCGHRDSTAQMIAFQEGNSTKEWPDSKHNSDPSNAVDVAPYNHQVKEIDWKDERPFYFLAGLILGIAYMKKIPIRWGGAWYGKLNIWHNKDLLMDLGHFESKKDREA